MTIFRKGLLLISLPLLFQFIFVGFLFKSHHDALEAEKWADHSRSVLNKAQNAFSHLNEAQSAARAVVITQNKMFQDQCEEALQEATQDMAELVELTKDNASQHEQAKRAQVQVAPMAEWLRRQANRAMMGEQDAAIESVKSLRGANFMEAFRKELDAFLNEEERLSKNRIADVNRTQVEQRWSIGLGMLTVTVVTCIAVYMFGRSIAMRLGTATANAGLLAENKVLSAPLTGSDEIATLDTAMQTASKRLLASASAEQQYKTELEERAEEMSRVNENLRQQTQENEMFVYSVSHDLRSPLVNLQGFSRELMHAGEELKELLADERVPVEVRTKAQLLLEQDVVSSVKFIQTAVGRSAAIIDALLRLSRAGRVEYRPQLVDVAGVVRRVIDAMSDTIGQKKADLIVYDLKPVWGDATAIEQVFGNLIGNAVNYLDPSRPGRIEIGMTEGGNVNEAGRRTYYIRDNGLGIPSAYIGKVFVAFQRLHGEVAKGEGIGLALVRRIIERHGGRASVESTVGVGTTFYVALPVEAHGNGEAHPAVVGADGAVQAKV